MSPTHTELACSLVDTLKSFVDGSQSVVIDGHNLDIAAVTAVSRRQVAPQLSTDVNVKSRVGRAADVVQSSLNDGGSLYGVTTGVGASAFTRTRKVEELQRALVAKNLNGILPPLSSFANSPQAGLILPEDFMKGTLMVRLNTLIRGHSGVRWTVIEAMFKLLEENVVPCAAKNNTVSASGDLGTLAYIAGTLLGLEDLRVWHGKEPERTIRPASEVLREIGLKTLTYGPKEAIAILNGTAASSSAAAQVLYDANVLLLGAQCLTVLSIEALRANLEPFQAFPHVVARPHPGQVEIAANIVRMTEGSKFAFAEYPEGDPEFLLRQDRYHIRCAPQWLGPFAESLLQATKEVNIELNSTTDNPIIDPDGQFPHNLYHAGNFQALSPAEAMDKVRHVMLGIGKILYAQHTEILNPMLNRGLPPDCAAGEPNLDYGLKSSDLACAAYLSELGFLSGSFLPHINSTEHHNQSINSMALASARYARNSVELLQQLVATQLYTVCQAVDLREMNSRYLVRLRELLVAELPTVLAATNVASLRNAETDIFTTIRVRFGQTTSLESGERFDAMLSPLVTELYTTTSESSTLSLRSSITPLEWVRTFAAKARLLFVDQRLEYFAKDGSAYDSLGSASRIVYKFIRHELEVPMKRGLLNMDKHEIGTRISEIFEAIRDGRMDSVFRDAVAAGGKV